MTFWNTSQAALLDSPEQGECVCCLFCGEGPSHMGYEAQYRRKMYSKSMKHFKRQWQNIKCGALVSLGRLHGTLTHEVALWADHHPGETPLR